MAGRAFGGQATQMNDALDVDSVVHLCGLTAETAAARRRVEHLCASVSLW
jgi:hypothetical protein